MASGAAPLKSSLPPPPASRVDADGTGEAVFQHALIAIRDEHWESALELLRDAPDALRSDQRLFAARATCLEQLGRLDEAETNLRRVVALAPDSPPAYVALGECLRKEGKRDEALRLMNALLHAMGTFGPALVLKAQLHVELQQYGEATASYEAALKHNDADDFALSGLADMHVRSGRAAEAEKLLRRVLKSKPDWWMQWAALGGACYMQSRFVEAAECYTRAVELSGDADCKVRRAAAHIQLERGDSALVDLDAVGSARDADPLVTLLRGWAHLQQCHWDDAATHMRRWLALDHSAGDGGDADQRVGVMLQCALALLRGVEARPQRPDRAEVVREAGALLERVGAGPPGGTEMLDEARALMQSCGGP